MRVKKYIFLFLFIFFCLFCVARFNTVIANNEYSHEAVAYYNVKDDKNVELRIDVKTINLKENALIRLFRLEVPFEPKNISVESKDVVVKIIDLIKNENNNYVIAIEFTHGLIGLNAGFDWSISMNIGSAFYEHGSQYALIIPNFDLNNSFDNFEINISVPLKFGKLAHFFTKSYLVNTENEYTKIKITKEIVNTKNIVALFGDRQNYSFYYKSELSDLKFSLPVENSYQSVIYTKFPVFENNKIDDYENITLMQNEEIEGYILTSSAYDMVFEKVDPIRTRNNQEILAKNDLVDIEKVLEKLYNSLELIDINITANTDILSKTFREQYEENKVNPFILNFIFRDEMEKLGYTTRGSYGFVYPITPFREEEIKVIPYIWSEVWVQDRWVSVNPVWYFTSEGSYYIDRLTYTHIKFGDFRVWENNVRNFFLIADKIRILPIGEINNKNDKSFEYQITEDKISKNHFIVSIKNLSGKIYKNLNLHIRLGDRTFEFGNVSMFPFQSVKRMINIQEIIYQERFESVSIELKDAYSKDKILDTYQENIKIKPNFYFLITLVFYLFINILFLITFLMVIFYVPKINKSYDFAL